MESVMELLQTSYLIKLLQMEFESAGKNSRYCTFLHKLRINPKTLFNYQYFQSLLFDFGTVNLQINKYD